MFSTVFLFGATKLTRTLTSESRLDLNYLNKDFIQYGQPQGMEISNNRVWLGRITSYRVAINEIRNNTKKLLVGNGTTYTLDAFFNQYDGNYIKATGISYYLIIPQLLIDLGLFGTLFFISFYLLIFFSVRKDYIIMKTVILVFIITGFFNNSWNSDFYNFLFWGMLGVYLRKNYYSRFNQIDYTKTEKLNFQLVSPSKRFKC